MKRFDWHIGSPGGLLRLRAWVGFCTWSGLHFGLLVPARRHSLAGLLAGVFEGRALAVRNFMPKLHMRDPNINTGRQPANRQPQ